MTNQTDNSPQPRQPSKSGCGCPGHHEDEAFQAAAWAQGIDVSHHNGTVNWLSVRSAGYSFAFLKATEGVTYVDNTFATNRDRAAAAKVAVGAYHFYRPNVSAVDQARNLVRTVGSLRSGELAPVLDIEDETLWKGISAANALKMVLDCAAEVQKGLGVRPYIYASPSFIKDVLANNPALRDFALWLANYTNAQAPTIPAPWTAWTFWQWSEKGRVPGVSTACDMNRFNGTEAQLAGLTKRSAVAQPFTTSVHHWWLRLLMRLGM